MPRPRGVPLGVSRRQPLGLLQAEVSVALAHNLQAGHPPSAQVWCSRKRLRQRKGARLLYSKNWLSTLLTLLVSAAPGFGAASQPAAGGFGGAAFGAAGGGGGTSICKWQRTQGADGQAGGTVSAQGNYMAITAMPQYQNFSFEELRVQDYEVCMLHDKQCNQRNPQLHSGRQASTTQLESITCDSWLLCAWVGCGVRQAGRKKMPAGGVAGGGFGAAASTFGSTGGFGGGSAFGQSSTQAPTAFGAASTSAFGASSGVRMHISRDMLTALYGVDRGLRAHGVGSRVRGVSWACCAFTQIFHLCIMCLAVRKLTACTADMTTGNARIQMCTWRVDRVVSVQGVQTLIPKP